MYLTLLIVEAVLLAVSIGGIVVSRTAWFARRATRSEQTPRPKVYTLVFALTGAAAALNLAAQLFRR